MENSLAAMMPSSNGNDEIEEIITNGAKGEISSTSSSTTDDAPKTPFRMPRAPPHVYSCFVKNLTTEPIEVEVEFIGRPDESNFDETFVVTIEPEKEKLFERQFFQPDLPQSYCKWVKIINKVTAKKEHGKRRLCLEYPFDNVGCPIRNWEFHVKENEILSRPPTRVVNLLKYENNEYL